MTSGGTPTQDVHESGTRARRLAAPLLVLAAVVVTYGNTLRNGFVWDDHPIVVDNVLNRSLANAWTVLTSSDVLTKSQPTGYYRPLSRFLYVLEYQLFGLEPWGYHLVNLVTHAAVALLFFAVARQLLRSEVPALVAALLVAVHPIHAEPVNLVSARNNMLAAACVLGAFLAYLRARDGGRRRLYAVTAGLYFAGLLFKETALMLLPFLVLFEATSGEGWRRAFRERRAALGALCAMAAAYLALRAAVLHSAVGQTVTAADVGAAAVNVLHSVPKYLGTIVLPWQLTVAYRDPTDYVTQPALLAAAWVAIALTLLVLIAERRPVTRIGLLWAAVNFVPVSTIIPFPSAMMAERYLYLPVLGLWLVVADQVELLRPRWTGARRLVAAAAAVLLVALSMRTVRRNTDWHDDRALFEAAVNTDPGSAFAEYNLGVILRDAGDPAGARHAWERAIAADPRHSGALAELGRFHAERGEYAAAERYLRDVLRVDERDAEAHFNLALVMERTGRPREALEQYAAFLAYATDEHAALIARVKDRVAVLQASIGSGKR